MDYIKFDLVDGYAPEFGEPDPTKLSTKEKDELLGLDKPRFIEVTPVTIFKEGKWKGTKYKRTDILEIVMNYHKLKEDTWTPNVKVSHGQGYKFVNDEWSEASHGRISNMWEDNGEIKASVVFGIDFYKNYIATKKLAHKSVEIAKGVEYNDKKYGLIISNVALLGTSMPGCGELGEIENDDSTYHVYSVDSKDVETVTMYERIGTMDIKKETVKDEESKEVTNESTEVEKETTENFDNSEESNKESASAKEEDSDKEEGSEQESAEEENQEKEENDASNEESEEKEELDLTDVNFSLDIKDVTKQFQAKFDIMVEEFKRRDAIKESVIQSYEKERVDTEVSHKVESLIEKGHVKPADRELCTEIFKAVMPVELNFTLEGKEVKGNAADLLNSLLKTYSIWQKEDVNEEDDNIGKDAKAALPTSEPIFAKFGSEECLVDRTEEHEATIALQEQYKAEGKVVSYSKCYREIAKL